MGSLPYFTTGTLRNLSDVPLVSNVPISVWPTSVRDMPVGREYTHDGECPIGYAEALEASNVRFLIGDTIYHVVDSTKHEFLPHCSLRLRQMRNA